MKAIKRLIRFTLHQLLNLINHVLAIGGLKLHRKSNAMPTVFDRLAHIKKLGFSASVIFDCGAHIGNWTKDTSALYPDAAYFLFEPNSLVTERIRRNLSGVPSKHHILVNAVGDERKEMYLNLWEGTDVMMTSSSLLGHVQGEPSQRVKTEVVTLDEVAAEHGVKPELIKLDLQGAEVAALKGCTELLKSTEVFIIEFGVLEAYEGRATPKEIMDILYANDYTLYDIVDLRYRPYDGALTGGDFIFVKNSSGLRAHKDYR